MDGRQVATVRFADCVGMLSWPDGARSLFGPDAMNVHVEPRPWRLPAGALAHVDTAIPADRVAHLPDRPAESQPRPSTRWPQRMRARLRSCLTRDKPANRYLQSREVLASLHGAANRSVRHPNYRRQRDWPWFHNIFAMAFALAGDRQAAAEQFDIIGDLATQWPWEYLDAEDPGRKFCALRADAYANRGWTRTGRS